MLTNDLLRFHIRRGRVYPDFIDPEQGEFLELANELLSVYAPESNSRRGELEDAVMDILQGCRYLNLAKGLNKLILDRCDFSPPIEMDYASRRREVLLKAAQMLLDPDFSSPAQLRRMVSGVELPPPLYADLPANERLIKFRSLTAQQLLQRYNVALVQGLLMTAGKMEVRTKEKNAAELRRMFKFLKFFRLLARIVRQEDKSLHITIDGPLSIVSSTRKYGLQLASFFPAVCHLCEWTLNAELTLKRGACELHLDESSGLVSHYRNFSAYVPEEVMLFANHFQKTVTDWKMLKEAPFITLPDGELIFPDFSFEHNQGVRVYLELFHRWHRGKLLPRLRHCIAKPEAPLLLGIDASLFKGELQELLQSGVLPEYRFFTFRDYPAVRKVSACLTGFAAAADSESQGPVKQ